MVMTAAVSLCVALPSRAEDLLLDRFSDYLESLRAQAGIPGLAAAIVGNNDILWERAFGRQDVDRGHSGQDRHAVPYRRPDPYSRPRSCCAASRKDASRSTTRQGNSEAYAPNPCDARQLLAHASGRAGGSRVQLSPGAPRSPAGRRQGLPRAILPRRRSPTARSVCAGDRCPAPTWSIRCRCRGGPRAGRSRSAVHADARAAGHRRRSWIRTACLALTVCVTTLTPGSAA